MSEKEPDLTPEQEEFMRVRKVVESDAEDNAAFPGATEFSSQISPMDLIHEEALEDEEDRNNK